MTFLVVAFVVSVALDVVEWASIRQEEREWHALVNFHVAQREADARRYADDGSLR